MTKVVLPTVNATYDRDSRHFHRFVIDEGQGIVGTIYIPKTISGIPDKVTVILKTKRIA